MYILELSNKIQVQIKLYLNARFMVTSHKLEDMRFSFLCAWQKGI